MHVAKRTVHTGDGALARAAVDVAIRAVASSAGAQAGAVLVPVVGARTAIVAHACTLAAGWVAARALRSIVAHTWAVRGIAVQALEHGVRACTATEDGVLFAELILGTCLPVG